MKDLTELLTVKTMYTNYLEMGLDACKSFNNTPLEDQVMKEFYLKQSQKYQHKAEALKQVLDLLED
tara:strand:+ start:742 stop:939 length:198 start_codon:yes stop_codon:yes gene_type:complete